jgi:hypothetical protein
VQLHAQLGLLCLSWQPANTQGNYLCPETKLLRICVHGDETLCKLLVVIVAPNIVANHQAYSAAFFLNESYVFGWRSAAATLQV